MAEKIITENNFPTSYSAEASHSLFYFSNDLVEYCKEKEINSNQVTRSSKCIFIGDSNVGKSLLVHRIVHDHFESGLKPTCGVDFNVLKLNILKIPFEIIIWDTAGQNRLECITLQYYPNSSIAVIVFDLNKMSSLGNVKKWAEKVLTRNSGHKTILFLVGSKQDLICESVFFFVQSEAIKIAKEIGAEYWSVSSLTGSNVEELFTRIAVIAFENFIQFEIEDSKFELIEENSTHREDLARKKKKKKSFKQQIRQFFVCCSSRRSNTINE